MREEGKCRVCESLKDLNPIFDGECNTIPLKLMSCANIQVLEKDGLPQCICDDCIKLLELSYTFKLQCEKVDAKLRIIAAHSDVEEDPNPVTDLVEYVSVNYNECLDSVDEEKDLSHDKECKLNEILTLVPQSCQKSLRLPRKTTRTLKVKRRKTCKEYPCTACALVFDSYMKWLQHRDTHGPKRYLCRICNKLFGKKAYLDKHQKTHEDINDIKIHECQKCFKKYTSKGNLQRHMRGHTGDLRHICDVCGKRFIQSTTLRSHQLTHQDAREWACNDCDKAFKSKQYLTHHREKMHSDSTAMNSFCCDICGRRFINERNLKWHIRNHIKPDLRPENKIMRKPKPREYCCVCTYCGKTFRQKAQLQIHQRIHTGEKPYECDLCQKKFRFQTSYKFHLNSHTGERPFACSMCDRRFKQPTHLRNHLQVHTGIKPYKCSFCNKSFASKSNMKVHTRIHTGERPYVCNECGLGFVDSNGLKKHTKKHIT